MKTIKVWALFVFMAIIVSCLLFILHAISFEDTVILLLATIGAWFVGSALIV